MQYRPLGRTGVRVSPLCFGAMNFKDSNAEEGVAAIRQALDAGVNFIDTANVYSRGESEQVVATAITGRRDEVVLATKVHGPMHDTDTNAKGNSRRHIKAQCDASLKRLGTDYIDLYQLHRPDADTPIEESLEALDDLVQAGKIHYVGFSDFRAWQTMEALAVADKRGLASAPSCEQPPYNLLDRRIEKDYVPLAQKYGIGIIPFSPLSFGLLTGKYNNGVPEGSRLAGVTSFLERPDWADAVDKVRQLSKVAEQAGLTMLQLALAWNMSQPGITAPIIGPQNRQQLADNLTALDVVLDADTLAAIDEIVPPGTATLALT